MAERADLFTPIDEGNSSKRLVHTRAQPVTAENKKKAAAIDIPRIPATKRRASDEAWNRNRLIEYRSPVENLTATMNVRAQY